MINDNGNGLPLSKKGSANAYSAAGALPVPADGTGRKQCTVLIPKQYGNPVEHRCSFMAIPGDTLCGTHRRRASRVGLQQEDKTVKLGDMLSIIVGLCAQLPRDNGVRCNALEYLRKNGIARDVVDEVLHDDWKAKVTESISATVTGNIAGNVNDVTSKAV